MSNFRNTVCCLNRFIGHSEASSQTEAQFWTCALTEKNGEAAASIMYRGEEKVFSATELMAMLLGKLKDIAQKELKSAVSDCVISVPSYFGETERRAMLDASAIAGLNCLRLVNDTTAAALGYGLTKNEQFTETPKVVCFVDIGFSSTKVSIVSFTKGHLEVKETHCEPHLGGRDFDEALVRYFSNAIKEQYNTDVLESKRGILRLRAACEKIKKVLSGIVQTKTDLETESRDFPLSMTRDQFEALTSQIIERLAACLKTCLSKSGLSIDDIDSVEIIGGSTRIPSVKNMISSFFGKDVSTTMNQDEAVSRGCAFQCAIESPSFRVREFGVKDVVNYPVKLSWLAPEEKEMIIFSNGSQLPSVKPVFFDKCLPAEMFASYYGALPPFSNNESISVVKISSPKTLPSETWKTRIDFEINIHGILNVKKVLLIEELIEEVKGDDQESHKRKIIREHEINYELCTSSLSTKAVHALKDQEYSLSLSDRYAQELDDSRNNLEEYIYATRSKLDQKLKPYLRDGAADAIHQALDQAESWLYSDHEAENKEMYQARLQDLSKIVEPINQQAKAHTLAQELATCFRQKIEETQRQAQDSMFTAEEQSKIQELCHLSISWIDSMILKQEQSPLYEKLIMTKPAVVAQQEKFCNAFKQYLDAANARTQQAETASPEEMNID